MNGDQMTCPICGGAMEREKTLSNYACRLIRLRCTCGHYEEIKDETRLDKNGRGRFVLEGFHEL
jgi:hypothetical protein